jgi:hypothetical protein
MMMMMMVMLMMFAQEEKDDEERQKNDVQESRFVAQCKPPFCSPAPASHNKMAPGSSREKAPQKTSAFR